MRLPFSIKNRFFQAVNEPPVEVVAGHGEQRPASAIRADDLVERILAAIVHVRGE
jgi:hypothetical protein